MTPGVPNSAEQDKENVSSDRMKCESPPVHLIAVINVTIVCSSCVHLQCPIRSVCCYGGKGPR